MSSKIDKAGKKKKRKNTPSKTVNKQKIKRCKSYKDYKPK